MWDPAVTLSALSCCKGRLRFRGIPISGILEIVCDRDEGVQSPSLLLERRDRAVQVMQKRSLSSAHDC